MYEPAAELVEIPIFPQDPRVTRSPVVVHVRGNLLPGPVGDRIAVFDYNRDRDEVYGAARPKPDGSFPDYDPTDLRFHQLNAYAITARAVELSEKELGRDLKWGFNGSRLIVLPHAGYMANAFYSETSHTLQLYSFVPDGSRHVYHTALSHDVVSHETGHAILDAVRGQYTESLEPETAAIHEGVGDLAALFAALSHDTIKKRVIDPMAEGRPNLVSEIAEHFEGDDQNLRSLIYDPKQDYTNVVEPHLLSLKLSRAIYEILRRLYKARLAAGLEKLDAFESARKAVQRMTVRTLGHLPPADATIRDFAIAMLTADSNAHPLDNRDYRAVVGTVFEEHGLLPAGGAATAAVVDEDPWRALPATWPRISPREAYEFLDRNRDRLALSKFPLYRDFVVSDLQLVMRPPLHTTIDQVIITYEYPVDVELKGKAFGPYAGYWLPVIGGGTLVFDAVGALCHHAEKPVTKARVDRLKDLIKNKGNLFAASKLTLEDEIRSTNSGRPWVLELRGNQVTPRSNPAARCGATRPGKERRQ
ncbi:MAG: hypothetical protein WB812_17055 [Woeseiaceae bacterium]